MGSDLKVCVICHKEFRTYSGSNECSDCYSKRVDEFSPTNESTRVLPVEAHDRTRGVDTTIDERNPNQNTRVASPTKRGLIAFLFLLLFALILVVISIFYTSQRGFDSEEFGWLLGLTVTSLVFILIERKHSLLGIVDLSVVLVVCLVPALIAIWFMYAYSGESWILWIMSGVCVGWFFFLLLYSVLLLDEFAPRSGVSYSGSYEGGTGSTLPQGVWQAQTIGQTSMSHSTAGYYQCLCGVIQHASRWGGSRKCSRCGKNMIWRR